MSALRQLLLPIFVSSFFIILTTAVLTAALAPTKSAQQLELIAEVSPTPTLAIATPTPTLQPSAPEVASGATDSLASLEKRITAIEKRLDSVAKPTNTVSKNSVRTYSIFLGSGSTTNRDWTEIPATSFTLTTENYPRIQAARFEASLEIIGGNATARLINKTTGAIISASEVTHSGSSQLIMSGSFSVPTGTSQFVAQLRSDSGELAVLEGARLQLQTE